MPCSSPSISGPLLLRCRTGLERILAGEAQALLAPSRKKAKGMIVAITNSGEVECRSPSPEAINILTDKCRVADSVSQRLSAGPVGSSPAFFKCTSLDDVIDRLKQLDVSQVPLGRKGIFLSQVESVDSKIDGGAVVAQKINSAISDGKNAPERKELLPLMMSIHDDVCSLEFVQRSRTLSRPWISPPCSKEPPMQIEKKQPSWSTLPPTRSLPLVRTVSDWKPLPYPALAAAAVLKTPLLAKLSHMASSRSSEELLVWDPFCGEGIIMLELASVVLGSPLSQKSSIPSRPHGNANRLRLIATDPIAENVSATRENLRRFSVHCEPWFPRGRDPNEGREKLGRKIKREEVVWNEEAADASNQLRDSITTEMGSKSDATRPIGSDVRTFSTDEDKTWNLPIKVSVNQAAFHTILPHIQGPMIITYINSQRFANHHGIRMFESFGHLIGSRNDWLGVYVLTDSKAFQTYSRLVWDVEFEVRTSSSGKLRLLRWTGLKKGEAAATTSTKRKR